MGQSCTGLLDTYLPISRKIPLSLYALVSQSLLFVLIMVFKTIIIKGFICFVVVVLSSICFILCVKCLALY